MSSSDDDISLAALAARATGKPMPTVVRQASTTISRQHAAALQQAKPAVPAARAGSASASRPGVKRKAPPVVSRPDDSSDDSDSDVPLSSLAKQAKGRATAAGSRSTQSSSAAAAKAKAPKRASSGVNTTKRPRTLQVDKQKGLKRVLVKGRPLKEQAVEAILVRWQYVPELASAWPPKVDSAKETPAGYRALPGFPGVYVGVAGPVCGKVMDKRPLTPRPSHAYLMTLPSTTLGAWWSDALKNQAAALAAAEGPGTPLEKTLREEQKQAEQYLKIAQAADQQSRAVSEHFTRLLEQVNVANQKHTQALLAEAEDLTEQEIDMTVRPRKAAAAAGEDGEEEEDEEEEEEEEEVDEDEEDEEDEEEEDEEEQTPAPRGRRSRAVQSKRRGAVISSSEEEDVSD